MYLIESIYNHNCIFMKYSQKGKKKECKSIITDIVMNVSNDKIVY